MYIFYCSRKKLLVKASLINDVAGSRINKNKWALTFFIELSIKVFFSVEGKNCSTTNKSLKINSLFSFSSFLYHIWICCDLLFSNKREGKCTIETSNHEYQLRKLSKKLERISIIIKTTEIEVALAGYVSF